ncbi:hypothetical protein PMI36_06154 [Pseudomonas sp. GM79]|nr:hypothetical protein PMI36_06154 [Pseudomonas sp. GM79]
MADTPKRGRSFGLVVFVGGLPQGAQGDASVRIAYWNCKKQCEGDLRHPRIFHACDASDAANNDVASHKIDPDQGDGRDLSARFGNRHDAVCAACVDLDTGVLVAVEHQGVS